MIEQNSALQWGKIVDQIAESRLGRDRTLFFTLKRFIDLVLATLLLALLLPLFLVIAIVIKLDSRGPVFFVQERVGSRRRLIAGQLSWEIRTFRFLKFRTMQVDVDPALHRQFMEAYIAGNTAKMTELQADPKATATFKLTRDPRVTRIGRFLRKTSLDELPQLWNVLKGDMSLVGPRPPIAYEVALYGPKDFQRLAVVPGITGLWQVSGRCNTSFEEMVALDLKYIDEQSLWLDFKILVMTLPVIISGEGAG